MTEPFPRGSIQRGENVIVELCRVRLLETPRGDRVLRASWRGAPSSWFHMTWEWTIGGLTADQGAEILRVISNEIGKSLVDLDEWPKAATVDGVAPPSTLWGQEAPADLLPPAPAPSWQGPPAGSGEPF